jgi:hypothetical protein
MDAVAVKPADSLDIVLEADQHARMVSKQIIAGLNY